MHKFIHKRVLAQNLAENPALFEQSIPKSAPLSRRELPIDIEKRREKFLKIIKQDYLIEAKNSSSKRLQSNY